MRAASQLPGRGSLMWMLPLYLHVNQKSDDDDDDPLWQHQLHLQTHMQVEALLETTARLRVFKLMLQGYFLARDHFTSQVCAWSYRKG